MDDGVRLLYSFPHPVGMPGIGTTALNQVRALSLAGAEVTLVCTSLHADVPASVKVHETLRVLGRRVPHRAFGDPDRALNWHDRVTARFMSRSFDRFNVVHTWPQSAAVTISVAREMGVISSREVPNTHTANAYEQAAFESSIVGVGLAKRHSHRLDPKRMAVEEREYATADILLVPSDHVASTFVARGFSGERLARHQYGYDPSRFSAIGRSEWPSRPLRAVFVGKCEPRKGLHYALEAWVRSRPVEGARLVVAGEFVPGYRDAVAHWLEHPSVEERGFVQDVPALFRESDLLVLPSVEEGSALVTYEAQGSGCIPLVSQAAGALLPDGIRPFVHSVRDVSSLTDHISKLMNDDGLRRKLREELLGWSPSLTWEAAGIRMLEIYCQALGRRRV